MSVSDSNGIYCYSIHHKTYEGKTGTFMSPVSPVFHTVVTVRIGLRTQLE